MSDVLTFAGTGGALIAFFWLAREPLDGAPLWTWQAWRLPDVEASYVDMRTIHTRLAALPVRRHDGTLRVWPDQGLNDEVADVAAIRRARDFTWSRPVVAAGAAGLAIAGAGAVRPVPYVAHDGRPGWSAYPVVLRTDISAADISAADMERLKTEFKASLGRPAMVLHEPVSVVEIVAAPAPSDTMALDLIEARLQVGLSNVVAAAMAALLEGATA